MAATMMAPGLPRSQTTTPLAISGFVMDDVKRVEKLDDRGEAYYRIRLGQGRRDIRVGETTDNVITAVGDQLDEAQVIFDPQPEEDCFIPRESFEAIITPEVIAQVVNQLPCYENISPKERIQVAGDIYYGKDSSPGAPKPCRKLLATLIGVQAGKGLDTVDEIKRHMDEGMNDDCLPLLSGPDGQLICRFHQHAHPFINHRRPRQKQWRKHFVRWSQTLMVPYIVWGEGPERLHRHYVMRGGGPLPMVVVSDSSEPHAHHSGGFGDVLKVKIHPGDRNFQGSGTQDSFFALKKLKENGESARTEFDLEVRSLIFAENRANHVPGPGDTETRSNAIQLLASFEIHDSKSNHPTYYLLFPWADGNLDEFWKQQDGKFSPRDPAQTDWMVEEFYRLIKALQCLHNDRQSILSKRTDSNRYGRHGDIKPGNFLFFDDINGPGFKLVLADFGLGRLHSRNSRSKASPNVPKTATYAAPEYDLEGGVLSPRSDIFSLGCVLLEHMVWLFQGHGGVEAFATERLSRDHYGFESDIFWKISESDPKSAEIKDNVGKQLATLKNHDDCVEVIGEILEMIEKMMLQPKQKDRSTAQELVHEMERIRSRWQRRDAFYGTRAWKDSITPPINSTITTLQDDAILVAESPNMSDATSASPDSSEYDPGTGPEPVVGLFAKGKPLSPLSPIYIDAGQASGLAADRFVSHPSRPGDESEGQTHPFIPSPPHEGDMGLDDIYDNALEAASVPAREVVAQQLLDHDASAPAQGGELEKSVVHRAMPNDSIAEFRVGDSDPASFTNPSSASRAMPSNSIADSDHASFTNGSYAESIFSNPSPAESVISRLSLEEVGSAKAEMVTFFLADAELRPLFVAAIKDPAIGGDRLERNFRRLLTEYSTEVLAIANVKIYRETAKLLRYNASFISERVRRHFEPQAPRSSPASMMEMEGQDEAIGKRQVLDKYIKSQLRGHGSGSDDAGPEVAVETQPELEQGEPDRLSEASSGRDSDEASIMTALNEVKEFLSSGDPISHLRTGLRNFVTPKLKEPEEQSAAKLDAMHSIEPETSPETSPETPPKASQIALEPNSSAQGVPVEGFATSLPDFVDYLFGFLPLPSWEPPVPPGKGRVRWKCKCGTSLYDDFTELEPGSLQDLETELRTANNGDSQPSHEYTWSATGILSALGNPIRIMTHSLRRGRANDAIELPSHNGPHRAITHQASTHQASTGTQQAGNLGTSKDYMRHLLCCMHSGETGTKLHQECISREYKDRELGKLLNEVYRSQRSILSRFTLRHVSKLHLTRFEVDFSSLVQIHLHDKTCHLPDCVCLPTPDLITCREYCCGPAPETKPTKVPVLGDNYLMHFFKSPECVLDEQKMIFNQLPKRLRGPLAAGHDEFMLGWGLYFEEGWHWRSIYFIFVVVVILSLGLGIGWFIWRGDIQSGFAITSTLFTLGSLVVGYLTLRSR